MAVKDYLNGESPVKIIQIKAAVFLVGFILLTTSLLLLRDTFIKSQKLEHTSDSKQGNNEEVLGLDTQVPNFVFNVNVPAFFYDSAEFKGAVKVEGKLVAEEVEADNLIYSLTASDGISVSSGQTPSIKNIGVISLQDKTGKLSLTAGTDISISGLTINNSSTLSTVRGRGGCTDCITDADIVGGLTISGGTVDNTPIGATTANTGAFTTLSASGATTLSSTLAVTGATTLSGALSIAGATTFTGTISSDFIPTTASTYSLGSSAKPWSALYLTGAATLGGQTTFTSSPTGTGVGNGSIYINPASVSDSSYTLFGIAVGGTEKLRMDANGNITVQGNLLGPTGGSIGYWTRSGTTLYPYTSGDSIITTGNLGVGLTAPVARFHLLGTSTSTGVNFLTQNSNKTNFGLSVLDNGNVGVGTTGPSYTLDIAQSNSAAYAARIVANTHKQGLYVQSSGSVSSWNTVLESSNDKFLQLTNGATGGGDNWTFAKGSNGALLIQPGKALQVLGLKPYDATAVNLLQWENSSGSLLGVINSSGNVGIGNTNPLASLYINGNAMIGYSSGAPASLANGLAVSGNVGIGTTNPTDALVINGNIQFTTSKQIKVPGGGDTITLLADDASLVVGSDDVYSRTNGGFHAQGEFGGTDTFSAYSGYDGYVQVTTKNRAGTGNAKQIFRIIPQLDDAGSDNFTAFFMNIPTLTSWTTGRKMLIDWQYNSATKFYMDYLGNVGIGSSAYIAPSKLNIGGNVGIGASFAISATPVNGLAVEGNVGVGTTSPLANLHVVGQCVAQGTRIRRRRRRRKTMDDGEIEDGNLKMEDGKIDQNNLSSTINPRDTTFNLLPSTVSDYIYEDIPVEEIKPGDEVLSLNDQTGKWEWHKVEATLDKGIQTVYRLETESGKYIETTSEHPYLVKIENSHQKTALADGFNVPVVGKPTIVCQTVPIRYHEISKLSSDNKKHLRGPDGIRTRTDCLTHSGSAINLPAQNTEASLLSQTITKWVKVSQLKSGMEIATSEGWEKVANITKTGRKQTYDLQIEGTHNFVGNNIVAHNTILQGLGTTTGLNFRVQDSTGADKFSILDNGNVGIGTTGPGAKLDLSSSSVTGPDFRITNTGVVTGTVASIVADSLTSGTALDISADALNSGKGLNLATTTTTAFSGSLANIDWSPTGSTNIYATGDLLTLSVGNQYGFAGNLLNIKDNGSSVFSVSQTAVTTSLPVNFTSPGDVSIAYDLNFTNPQASYIKSSAPLYLTAGANFNSSDLTLGTYNNGQIVLDTPGGVTLNQYQPWTLNNSSTMAWNIINSSGTTLMSFDTTNGNVGVGRSGPYGKLSVFGAGSTTGITFSTQGTTTQGLAVLDNGNVGIGTTAPLQKLDLVTGSSYGIAGTSVLSGTTLGTGVLTSSLTTVGALASGSIASGFGTISTGNTITTTGTIGTTATTTFTGAGATFSGNVLFGGSTGILASGGNVGVGTTSPLANLHVVGQCVTGDTLLKRRRRRKTRKNSDDQNTGESDDLTIRNSDTSGSLSPSEFSENDYEDIRIDQIQPGDEILTLNEKTGEFVTSKIKALQNKGKQEVFELVTESGKSIQTTSEHPYLTLSGWKKVSQLKEGTSIATRQDTPQAVFAFVDETGISTGDPHQKEMGVGVLTLHGTNRDLFEFNRKLRKVLISAIDILNKQDAQFEFKFKSVTKRSLPLQKKLLKIMSEHRSLWSFSWEFQPHGQDVWDMYLNSTRKIFDNLQGKFTVLLDFLDKPRRSTRTLVEIEQLSSVANTLQVESQGTIFLQVADIILGGLAYTRSKRRDIVKRKLSEEVLGLILGNKKATADPVCVASSDENIPQKKGFVKFEKVISIKSKGRKQTFDIEVEGTHNFVGNNIVAHNTILQGLGTTTGLNFRVQDSGGADKFTILDNGNVGIGTTNPQEKFVIHDGGFYVTDSDVNHGMTVLAPANAALRMSIASQTDGGAFFRGLTDGNSVSALYFEGVQNTGLANIAAVTFRGAKKDGTSYQALSSTDMAFDFQNLSTSLVSILGNGNVGIGTASPLAKLGVLGNAVIGATYGSLAAPTSGLLVEGNVGIGTTSPFGQFQVGSGVTPGLFVNSGNVGIGTTGPVSLLDINKLFNVFSSGLVGIGTTTPLNLLSVSGGNVAIVDNTQSIGTGADGACSITDGTITLDAASSNSCAGRGTADAVSYNIATSVSAGATSIDVGATPTGIAANDEVLIINLRGTSTDYSNVGKYETAVVTSVSSTTLNLDRQLKNTYDGTTQKIMIQRVPNYTTVTIGDNTGAAGSAVLTVGAFSTTTGKGGVIFFRATGAVTVNSDGKIDGSGKGYAGGTEGAGGITYNGTGGAGGASGSAGSGGQGGGGGAGHSNATVGTGTIGGAGGGGGAWGDNYDAGSGGGGGYGSVGTGGPNRNTTGGNGSGTIGGDGGTGTTSNNFGGGGGGGGTYGSVNLSTIYFGSGAGGGGYSGDTGGNGGGIIFVEASVITVNGIIGANGTNGAAGGGISGGGGAGGSIYLKAVTQTLGSSLVSASGGIGNVANAYVPSGGNGGSGRIRLDYNTSTGTTSPSVGYTGNFTQTDASLFINRTSSYGDLLGLQYNGVNRLRVDSFGNVGIGVSVNPVGLLQVGSNVTPGLFVNSSGNVGIGTTGPVAKLSFVAATTAAGGIDFGGDTNLYRSAANTLATDDTLTVASGVIQKDSTTGTLLLAIRSTGAGTTGANITLTAHDTINNGGYAGFNILGGQLTNDVATSISTVRGVTALPNASSNKIGGQLVIQGGHASNGGSGNDGVGGQLTLAGGQGAGTGIGGSIIFQTAPAGTTGSSLNALETRMLIDSTGNVGIGTASPTSKFQVSGGNVGIGVTTAISTLAVNGNSTIGWGLTGVAGPTNGLAVLGNVGIGTTSPSALLQVQGTGSVPSLIVTSGGNVGIGTSVTSNPLTVGIDGSTGNGAYLSAGGTWTNGSSFEFKENFTSLDTLEILNKINLLNISSWNYKLEPGVTHIGPVAEEFYSMFGVGNDSKHISTIDPSGIALAGIKELTSRIMILEDKIASLSAQIATDSAILRGSTSKTQPMSSEVEPLSLTPPEVLLATDSAQLDSRLLTLDSYSDATISGQLKASEAVIQETFKSLGKTFLGNTIIAGGLTVDGTMSITSDSINSVDTLFLQNSLLSKGLDILNGLFVFDSEGNLTVSGKVLAEQFAVKKGQTSGVGKISSGDTKVAVVNKFATQDSLILLTPHRPILQSLAVTNKNIGSFSAQLVKPEEFDLEFDYLIIGQE